MIEFKNLEKELELYKNDLVNLYNSKMGNNKHSLIVVIENHIEGNYVVKIVGPEEVEFIEKGRGPGKQPPVDVMREWVKNKLHVSELPRQNQLAYLVGRKISIEGTKGNHYIEQCVRELNATYNKRLQTALDKDMDIVRNNAEKQLLDNLGKIF